MQLILYNIFKLSNINLLREAYNENYYPIYNIFLMLTTLV